MNTILRLYTLNKSGNTNISIEDFHPLPYREPPSIEIQCFVRKKTEIYVSSLLSSAM